MPCRSLDIPFIDALFYQTRKRINLFLIIMMAVKTLFLIIKYSGSFKILYNKIYDKIFYWQILLLRK